ncbi:uncharacterized protein LOC130625073 [Hydractinia symbiolongicarpus]|uniref:uncharacterized protein LOC130625073 n=1 Tax=Hydractinia symbiolongicarpus TaxID=13093 RepID=UPI00254BFA87|nr:uncharacterized protein LOC130625073 [Hydractinia symbiolongicarpus]
MNKLPIKKNTKPFWVVCKPYFSNKHAAGNSSNIILIEQGNIMTKSNDIAKTFNCYFGNIVSSLNLYNWPGENFEDDLDIIDNIINKFKFHPSVLAIKQNTIINGIFTFKKVSLDDIKRTIKNLPTNKASSGEIPVKILKQSEGAFKQLLNCINKSFDNNEFPDILKEADVSPVFEKLIYEQLNTYIQQYLHKLLCGFRKSHSTQHALYRLIQAWQKELDNGGFVGSVLMDLSKAYDCLSHDLLIAKLAAYESEVCNFADDNKLYACGLKLATLLNSLTVDTQNMLHWFKINSLKANPTKFQFIILGKKTRDKITLPLESVTLNESDHVTLLGIQIDNKLNFNQHINNLYSKANFKLHALRRLRPYLSQPKAKILSSSFIQSQFNYAPLIWMFCSKTAYSKIERVHYKTLKVVYDIVKADYIDILEKYKDKSIHQRHLKTLAIEVFKSIKNLNPEFMWCLFSFNTYQCEHNLRRGPSLTLPKAKTTTYGTNSILYQSCWIWNNLPREIKNSSTIEKFTVKLACQDSILCNCKICKKK